MAYRELKRITLAKRGINYKNTGAVLLFTTPPDFYCGSNVIYMIGTNIGTSPTSGTSTFGTNSPSYNNILTSTSVNFSATGIYRILSTLTFGISIPPNTDIYMNITSGGTTASGNYTLAIFMELYIYEL